MKHVEALTQGLLWEFEPLGADSHPMHDTGPWEEEGLSLWLLG